MNSQLLQNHAKREPLKSFVISVICFPFSRAEALRIPHLLLGHSGRDPLPTMGAAALAVVSQSQTLSSLAILVKCRYTESGEREAIYMALLRKVEFE